MWLRATGPPVVLVDENVERHLDVGLCNLEV